MESRDVARANAVLLCIARLCAVIAVLGLGFSARGQQPDNPSKPFPAEAVRLYENEVRPILAKHCLKCHGEGPKIRGGFRLDTREAFCAAATWARPPFPASHRKACSSRRSITTSSKCPRPASCRSVKSPSSRAGCARAWPGPRARHQPPLRQGRSEGSPHARQPGQAQAGRPLVPAPVSRPEVPRVRQAAWCATPIDAFSLKRLEAEGLKPAPPADRPSLIRRLTYDLTGLPPSPQEVDAFTADQSPGAFERLTDRLLASPHYGEKWGRHWLDLVRYGETNGYERDSEKPFAWRYRDYVIAALNQDKPFDQFIREQLAGDEIQPKATEALIATGFYRLGIWDDEPADRELARYDGLDGIISTTSQVFMGISVNCARCHDHKVDPIPQRDYYRLLAVFHGVTHADGKNLKKMKTPAGRTIDVMSVSERGQPATHILLRGNPQLRGDKVEPGVPQVLGGLSFTSVPDRSPRRAFADWLTDTHNPRTARVAANRIWQYHFSRGIVPTPNEFGGLGEPASHTELLDWLASELTQGGWRLKRIHRMIVLSSAYQMSSHGSAAELARDPSNRWLWRFPMRRLTAEEVRDSMLSVAGNLNLKAGGPPVHPPIPREVLAGQSVPGQGWSVSPAAEAARRSIFVHVKRSLQVPILATHDAADTDLSCPVRYTTTVPTQALGLLNGAFANEQAARFAERLTREAPASLESKVRLALTLVSGRKPHESEVRGDVAFVQGITAAAKLDPSKALTQYCLLLLNSNAFLYLD